MTVKRVHGNRRYVQILALVGLAAFFVTACTDRIQEEHGTDPGTGRYDYKYDIEDFGQIPIDGVDHQRTAFSSQKTVLTLPRTLSGREYVPGLTVYVNSGGQHGTNTLARNQCTNDWSCYIAYNTAWYQTSSASTVWCNRNGSMYANVPFDSTTGNIYGWRYYICNGGKWSGYVGN